MHRGISAQGGAVKVCVRLVYITSAEPHHQSEMQIIAEINGGDLDTGVTTKMLIVSQEILAAPNFDKDDFGSRRPYLKSASKRGGKINLAVPLITLSD